MSEGQCCSFVGSIVTHVQSFPPGPVWEAAVGGIGGAFGVVFLKKREAGGKISIG